MAKAKSTNQKVTTQDKKTLSRKEKLESVRKANQALLKALALMAGDNETDAQSDV
ncbi:hypothetical protein [Phormidesmis priestleyi]